MLPVLSISQSCYYYFGNHFPDIHSDNFAAKLLHGWWMGSIVAVQTGYPFSPLIGSDREQAGIFTGANIDRPSYVTSANLSSAQAGAVPYNHGSVIVGSPKQWYNPNMFTLQPMVTAPGGTTVCTSSTCGTGTTWGTVGNTKLEFTMKDCPFPLPLGTLRILV